MCTSIVVNKNKTIVGWNLDLLDMEYRVRSADEGVYIEYMMRRKGGCRCLAPTAVETS